MNIRWIIDRFIIYIWYMNNLLIMFNIDWQCASFCLQLVQWYWCVVTCCDSWPGPAGQIIQSTWWCLVRFMNDLTIYQTCLYIYISLLFMVALKRSVHHMQIHWDWGLVGMEKRHMLFSTGYFELQVGLGHRRLLNVWAVTMWHHHRTWLYKEVISLLMYGWLTPQYIGYILGTVV